jgi:hypothetical protein
MTERERWVVYPLLFLALGVSLRDKLIDRTTARVIVCQELQVVDEDFTGRRPTRTLARIGPHDTQGGAPVGYLGVDGIVDVNGLVQVDGAINAKQYGISPGGNWQDLLRGLRDAVNQAVSPNSGETPAATEVRE